jgi:hypothetical protein
LHGENKIHRPLLGDFALALRMMEKFAHAAREGPWGQGREVWQDPDGTPHDDQPAFKTARNTMRYAEEGGASLTMGGKFTFMPPVSFIWRES